ncbi:MAG TPA: efflux RND transporter periplasmic adaptor subunit [Bryobacteraceae bacterium]|jgi:RND family efflux transporter MFP subunit|nr:efflux RND transporter periplasmic adaptor subunit [Bryobacteraceae bacterium]
MLRTLKVILIVAIVVLIAGTVVIRGIHSRINAAAVVRERTLEESIPSVTVIHPKRGELKEEIALPGNIQAFVDAPVYARTSGYLKKWYSDIGTRVKTGDALAEIDSPEVDQQLAQAKAQLATAQANLKLAEVTMNRDLGLLKDAIPKQDVDNAVGAYEADKATVEAQLANMKHLEQLVAFEKVLAPFDGLITARNTDVGQLVNAGNGGTAQELFRISSTDKLRIFISVPQMFSQAAIAGVLADLTLTEAPGRHYTGKVARNTGMIDPTTRTLLTEVDIDNTSGKLMPGAYAEVHLKLPAATAALVLPVTALIFRSEGLQVAVVRDGNRAELVHVTQGRDFGTEVEITSGITAADSVIINTPDSLTSGAPVRVEPAAGRP